MVGVIACSAYNPRYYFCLSDRGFTMQIMLHHVSIPRPAGEESAKLARRFYGELVGLTEKPVPTALAPSELIWFQVGDVNELHIFTEAESAITSGRHFCLNVGDVEAMRQTLIGAGYEPWAGKEIPGRPRFFCRDPFQNVVEFTQIVDNYLKYQ